MQRRTECRPRAAPRHLESHATVQQSRGAGTVVAVDEQLAVGKRARDGAGDGDVALQASGGWHPFIPAADLELELAVAEGVVGGAIAHDLIDAGGLVGGVEVVEVDYAGVSVSSGRRRGFARCRRRWDSRWW